MPDSPRSVGAGAVAQPHTPGWASAWIPCQRLVATSAWGRERQFAKLSQSAYSVEKLENDAAFSMS